VLLKVLSKISLAETTKTYRAAMKLKFRPLTPNLWPALADLFGENGACSGCWCMYWRIGNAYRKRPRETNKAAFHEVVKRGPPPGLLAFHGDLAVGWCQLTPRDALPWLDRAWRLRRVDDVPVWSISCFYIRKGYRNQGVTSALIAAALKTAKSAGAPALEAYPLDGDLTPSASGTGYASTFARAGFSIVGRRTPPRPIMRRDLTASSNQAPSRQTRREVKKITFTGWGEPV
jgi:GNAT superfamily N-acetyltransferase